MSRGNEERVRDLLCGNFVPSNDIVRTLHVASAKDDHKMAMLLLNMRVNVNAEVQDMYGGSINVLYIASDEGHRDVVELLIPRAKINAPGGLYALALQVASAKGHEDVVKLLIDARARVNDSGTYFRTTLQIASAKSYAEVVKLLLKNGVILDGTSSRPHRMKAIQE